MFWKNAGASNPLLGRWAVDPSDAATVHALGDVVMEFEEHGKLRYVIRAVEKDQIILMTYRIEGDHVITDQPSHPNPQTTRFFVRGQSLQLDFEGVPSKFVRIE